MKNIIIRKATINDLQRIRELNNDLFELELANFDNYLIKGWPLSDEGEIYFKNAIKNNFVIFAEVDNKVMGYLLGEKNNIPYYNFKIAELCNMCVDENYRKHGIGKALYRTWHNTLYGYCIF